MHESSESLAYAYMQADHETIATMHGCVKLICVANVGSQLAGPITRRTFAEQRIMVISTMIVKPGTTLHCYIKTAGAG